MEQEARNGNSDLIDTIGTLEIGSKNKLEFDSKPDCGYDLAIVKLIKVKNPWLNKHLNRVEVDQY